MRQGVACKSLSDQILSAGVSPEAKGPLSPEPPLHGAGDPYMFQKMLRVFV